MSDLPEDIAGQIVASLEREGVELVFIPGEGWFVKGPRGWFVATESNMFLRLLNRFTGSLKHRRTITSTLRAFYETEDRAWRPDAFGPTDYAMFGELPY